MGKNSNKDEEYDDDFDMGEFRQKYIMFDRLFFEVSKAVSSKHLKREMARFFIFEPITTRRKISVPCVIAYLL